MRIELACDVCGNNNFSFPEAGGDDALVACADCGHALGNMGDLKQAISKAVIAKSPTIKIRNKPRELDD